MLNLTAHLLKLDSSLQGKTDKEIIAEFRKFLNEWEKIEVRDWSEQSEKEKGNG